MLYINNGLTISDQPKRDASNNVIYCTTGTNDSSDKIVYARGVSGNVRNAQEQTTYGSHLVSCPPANDRTFTNKYGSVTFPAVANAYEVGWTGYALLNTGSDDWYDAGGSFERLQNWSNGTNWADVNVMYNFFQTVAFASAYMKYANLYFTLLAGAGALAGKSGGVGGTSCIVVGKDAPEPPVKTVTTSATPASPLTTTISNAVSSSVSRGGSAHWYDQSRSRNIRVQVAYAPAQNSPNPPMIINSDFDLKYDYESGSYNNPDNVSLFSTPAHGFPGFIMRCIYINSPQNGIYAKRTYSGSISHERTNTDGSKFMETGSWGNPGSSSSIDVALTQTL